MVTKCFFIPFVMKSFHNTPDYHIKSIAPQKKHSLCSTSVMLSLKDQLPATSTYSSQRPIPTRINLLTSDNTIDCYIYIYIYIYIKLSYFHYFRSNTQYSLYISSVLASSTTSVIQLAIALISFFIYSNLLLSYFHHFRSNTRYSSCISALASSTASVLQLEIYFCFSFLHLLLSYIYHFRSNKRYSSYNGALAFSPISVFQLSIALLSYAISTIHIRSR